MTDRHTLEGDLLRYQEAGDFAAQAGTLMALAKIAQKEAVYNKFEDTFGLLQGLCMQSYAVYNRLGNKRGMTAAVKFMAESIYKRWDYEAGDFMGYVANPEEVFDIFHVATALYNDLDDMRGQAAVYKMIGEIYEGETARIALEKSLFYYEKLNNMSEQARVLCLLSYCYLLNALERQRILERALRIYELINDRPRRNSVLNELYRLRQDKPSE